MPSSRDHSGLPDIEGLRRLLQALAMLDSILCPEWGLRYYSFNAHWGRGQMLGSMKNGSGDEFFAAFNRAGCLLKGFAHEAPMSPHQSTPPRVPSGVLTDVPLEFSGFLREPAFDMENTTFCLWRMHGDEAWHKGRVSFPPTPDPDGSEYLLAMLDGNPLTYKSWAEEYYGEEWGQDRKLSISDVARIYQHEPLTEKLVVAINPDRKLSDLTKDTREIGYPI